MANPIAWLYQKLFGFYPSIDNDSKRRVVKYVVDAYEGVLRAYFRMKTDNDHNPNPPHNDQPSGAEVGTESYSKGSLISHLENVSFFTYHKILNEQLHSADRASLACTIGLSAGVAAYQTGLPEGVEGLKFLKLAKAIVQDEKFVKDFSDAIGGPLDNETEDMFVERASAEMKSMLISKFGKAKG